MATTATRTRKAPPSARPRPRRPAPRGRRRTSSRETREILGIALIGLGVFLGAVLFLGVGGGPVGEGLESGIRLLVGRAIAIVPLIVVLVGINLLVPIRLLGTHPFRVGAIVLGAALLLGLGSGTVGFGGTERSSWFDPETMRKLGGAAGEGLSWATGTTVGDVGTGILVVVGLIVGAILVTGASLGHAMRASGRGAATATVAVGRGVATATATAVRGSQRITQGMRARRETGGSAGVSAGAGGALAAGLVDGADHFPDIFGAPGGLPRSPALGPGEDALDAGPGADGPGSEPGTRDAGAPAAGTAGAPDVAEEGSDVEPSPPPFRARPSEPSPRAWRPPPRGVLRRSSGAPALSQQLVRETSRRLEEALAQFGVEAAVVDTVSGPRVTRYEMRLAPGTKVSRVTALRDDLAYALAARDEIRILAPIPGKQAVGVEVPNPEATLVTLGDIWRDFPEQAGPLVAWLGLDIGGKPVYLDIARMPHLLIAGSTGTGKSVCLNALLASILLRATPEELRLVMIDPKKVELNHYEGIPHLLTPVVTNMKNATAVLGNLVREMEARYELMGVARARNLRDWNAVRSEHGEAPVPAVLVVIDELADLMMVSPAEVEDAIIRLAQKSRAVGIHLVLATQRPSVDVITGMIKANVPSRVAFAVSSQVDSRVVLDASGAESLLGHGDMLFRPVGSSRLQRLQGAYVSEAEILAITDHWRRQGRPALREELLEREDPVDDVLDPDADDLVDRAIEMVVQQGTASVSLLQRRLGVGYARAGRLVDVMERMGVVSGHDGSKPRTVLVGEGDLARLTRRGRDDGDDDAGPGGPDPA